MRNLEILIELDGICQHECGDPLKLVRRQIFLKFLQVALQSLLVYQRQLIEYWGTLGLTHHWCVSCRGDRLLIQLRLDHGYLRRLRLGSTSAAIFKGNLRLQWRKRLIHSSSLWTLEPVLSVREIKLQRLLHRLLHDQGRNISLIKVELQLLGRWDWLLWLH
jgi:hypothetical protein